MLDDAFAQLATAFSDAFGGPYWDAQIITPAAPAFDDGGSIIPGSGPTFRACKAQVDATTEQMRLAEGFVEQDRRVLILAGGFVGTINADDRLSITAGPYAGAWLIQSVARDPMAIYFELRARPA